MQTNRTVVNLHGIWGVQQQLDLLAMMAQNLHVHQLVAERNLLEIAVCNIQDQHVGMQAVARQFVPPIRFAVHRSGTGRVRNWQAKKVVARVMDHPAVAKKQDRAFQHTQHHSAIKEIVAGLFVVRQRLNAARLLGTIIV